MFWIEIRPGLKRVGKIKLVPISEVNNYRGFRSVYGYDDTTKDLILDTNSTANLRGVPVYADTLLTDFDDHDPVEFRLFLRSSGLDHTEWHSGGRSYHFHIRLQPLYESWVPAACKAWVRSKAPTADLSFYTTSGMHRLPGTFHNKYPGQCKHLLYAQEGTALVLSEPEHTTSTFETKPASDSDFWLMLHYQRPPGQRTSYIWLLGTTAAESGIAIEDAIRNVCFWNSQQQQPHPDDYVSDRVTQAYRRIYETK